MTSRSTPRRIVLCEIQEVLTSLRLNERFAVGGSSLDRHGGSSSSLSGSGGSSNGGSSRGGGSSNDGGGGIGGNAPLSAEVWREPPLVANLKALRVACRAVDDRGFMEMSALVLVVPFLEVIKSEETSGDVTGAALGALASLLQGGVLDPPPQPLPSSSPPWHAFDSRGRGGDANAATGGLRKATSTSARQGPNDRTLSPPPRHPPRPARSDLSAALADVVEAVSSCRFEFTDAARDEVVVAQVIDVLKLCVVGPRGRLLPDERVWDVVQDCFAHRNTMIHSQALCHVAEEALLCLVRQVFGRFRHTDTNNHPHQPHQQQQQPHGFGLPVAVKLFGFLCAQLQKGPTPHATGGALQHGGSGYSPAALAGGGAEALQGLVNRDATRRLCLKMVRIALEEASSGSGGGRGGGSCSRDNSSGNGRNGSNGGFGSGAMTESPAIQALIRDDLCAALLWMGQGGQPHLVSPPTLVEALAVVRLLWGRPLRVFLKVQLEALLLGVFLRQLKHLSQVAEWHSSDSSVDLVGVLNGDSSAGSSQTKGRRAAASSAASHHKSLLSLHEDGSAPCSTVELEAILECLGDLMAEPALVVDLFVNFDCDLARADVLEATVALLAFCARSPAPALQGGARALCMEALLNGLKALNSRCSSAPKTGVGGGGDLSPSASPSAGSECGGDQPVASSQEEGVGDETREESEREAGDTRSIKGPSSPLQGQHNNNSFASHPLWQRKLRKRTLRQGALLFNQKPRSGFIALQEANLLPKPLTPEAAVKFLRTAPGLDKAVVGSYLGESGKSGKDAEGVHEADTAAFHAAVLVAFGNSFDFKGQPLVAALRMFLSAFRLPGEAQQIDRVIQAFADAAFEHCVDAINGSLPTPDAVYLLAFSIILLHTDVHNPNIASEKKMTVDAFVKNNTNYGVEICKGRDLPRDLLESVYDAISSEEFETHASQEAATNSGHNSTSGGSYSDGVPAVTLGLNTAISSARWRDLLKSVEKDPLAGLLLCPIGTDDDDGGGDDDSDEDDDDNDDGGFHKGSGSASELGVGGMDGGDEAVDTGRIEPLETMETTDTVNLNAADPNSGLMNQDFPEAPPKASSTELLNAALQTRMLRVPSEFPGHVGSAGGGSLSLESAQEGSYSTEALLSTAATAAATVAGAGAAETADAKAQTLGTPAPLAAPEATSGAAAPLHVSEVDPMVLHLLWKPVLEAAAGLFLLGKAAGEHASPSALRQAVDATLVLAKLAARHELQAVFDTLVYVLASFTGLLAPWPSSGYDKYAFGSGSSRASTSNSNDSNSQTGQQQQRILEVPSITAQVMMLRNLVTSPASRMAAVAVFGVAHRLGAHLRAAWQPVVRLVFRLRDLQLLDSSLLLTESDEDFLPPRERHYYTHLLLDKAQARRHSALASSSDHYNDAGDGDRSNDRNQNNTSKSGGGSGGGGILGWFFGAASAPTPNPSNSRRSQRRRRRRLPSSSSITSEGAQRADSSSGRVRVPRCEMWNDGAHVDEGNGNGSTFSGEFGAPFERSLLSDAEDGYMVWSDNSDDYDDDNDGGTARRDNNAEDRSSISTDDDEEDHYDNFYDDEDSGDSSNVTADRDDGTRRSSGHSFNFLPGEGRWNNPAYDPELASLLSERQQLRSIAKDQFAACQVGELIHDCRELSDESLWAFLHALTAAVHAHLPSDERRSPPSLPTASKNSKSAGSRGNDRADTSAPEQSAVKSGALPLVDEGTGLLPLDLHQCAHSGATVVVGTSSAGANETETGAASSEALHVDIDPVNRPNMYLPPLSPPSLAFAEVLITEIALRNRDRLSVVWPLLSAHYSKRLSGASHVSLGAEKAAYGLLRLCCRAGGRPKLAPLLLSKALSWLLPSSPTPGHPLVFNASDGLCRPRVHYALLPLVGSALLRSVRLHASALQLLPTPQHWAPLLALLTSCAHANHHRKRRRHLNRRREDRSRENEGTSKSDEVSYLKLTDFLCAEAVLAQSGRLRAFKALTSIVQDHRLLPDPSSSSSSSSAPASSGLPILAAAQCCAAFWETSRAMHMDLHTALRHAKSSRGVSGSSDKSVGEKSDEVDTIATSESDRSREKIDGSRSTTSTTLSPGLGLYAGSTRSRVTSLESSLTALATGAADLLAILLHHLTKSLVSLSIPAASLFDSSNYRNASSSKKGKEVKEEVSDEVQIERIPPDPMALNDWYMVLAMLCRICGEEESRPSVRAHALHVLRSVLLEQHDSLTPTSISIATFQKTYPGTMHRAIATLLMPLPGSCRDARVRSSKETEVTTSQSSSEKAKTSSNRRSSSGHRRRRASDSEDDDAYNDDMSYIESNNQQRQHHGDSRTVPGMHAPGPSELEYPEAAIGGERGMASVGSFGGRVVTKELLSPHRCAYLAPLLDDATTAEAIALELVGKSFLRHLTSLHPLHLPGASASSFTASDPPFHELWLQVLGALQRCMLSKHPPHPPPPPSSSHNTNSSSSSGDSSPRALAARALAAKSAALTSPPHHQGQVQHPVQSPNSQEPTSSDGASSSPSMNPLQATVDDCHREGNDTKRTSTPSLSSPPSLAYPAPHALHWIAVEYLKALLLSLAELGAFTPGNHTVGRELWEFTWTVLMHAPGDHSSGGSSAAWAGETGASVDTSDNQSHHSNSHGSARSNRIGSGSSHNRNGRSENSDGDPNSSGSGNVAASVLRSLFPDHDFHRPPSPTPASALPPRLLLLPSAPRATEEGAAPAGGTASVAAAEDATLSSDVSSHDPFSRDAPAMRVLETLLPEEIVVLLVTP